MRWGIAIELVCLAAGLAPGGDGPPGGFAVENRCPPAFVVVDRTGGGKKAGCICGDKCKCGKGACPGKCPVAAPAAVKGCTCKSQGGPLPEACPCGKPGKCPCADPWRGLTSDELRKLDPWYDWYDEQTKKKGVAATPAPAGYPAAPAGFRWAQYPGGVWGLVQDGAAAPKGVQPSAAPFLPGGPAAHHTTPTTPVTGAGGVSSSSSGFYRPVATYTRVAPAGIRGSTSPGVFGQPGGCPPGG